MSIVLSVKNIISAPNQIVEMGQMSKTQKNK